MTISYVIIAYNSEKYIKKCIESILEQKHHEQIIVINDGSTDNTDKIVKSFNNKEIEYICHKENKGCCFSRMEGMKLCNKSYMTFIDSDDYYMKQLPRLTIFSPDIIDYGLYGSFNSAKEMKNVYSNGPTKLKGTDIWDYYMDGYINQIIVNKLISKRVYKQVSNNLNLDGLSNYCDNLCIMSAYAHYAKSYKCVRDVFYYYRQGSGMTTNLPRINRMEQYCNQKEGLKSLEKIGINTEKLLFQVTYRAYDYYKWIHEVCEAMREEKILAKKEHRKEEKPNALVNIDDDKKAYDLLIKTYKNELKKYNLKID